MNEDISGKVIGAAIEVHKVLGSGLLEFIYEEAFCCELYLRDIRYQHQRQVDIDY